jgi:hypothetical protein
VALRSHRLAAVEDRLRAVERGLVDERFEIAARRDAAVQALDLADVDPVPQHVAKGLRGERTIPPRPQAGIRGATNDFVRRGLSRREILERLLHQRATLRIVHEAGSTTSGRSGSQVVTRRRRS